MKKVYLLLLPVIMILLAVFCQAQTTLTLQPDSTGKDAIVDSYFPTFDNSASAEFNSHAWTHLGDEENERGFIDFDYSSIPAGAIIQSATLTLYNNPNSINGFQDGKHSHISGSNQSHLRRITQPWLESANWNNQPATDTLNEVVLLQDTNPNQDYTLDVTSLVQDRIDNPTTNYGFALMLDTEAYYRCLLFASGDHQNAALHPKLVIVYTACVSLVLQPDSAGKDAIVDSYFPTFDNSASAEFNSHAWTHLGDEENERGFIDFDYAAIPAGAIIQSATLTLYNNPNSINGFQDGKHSHISGSNQSHLMRITQPWLESVNWNNQPATDTLNEVVLLQDTNPNQDYTLDVTRLVQDRIDNPTANYGFALMLDTEAYYRCLLFASGDHQNAALHPRLELCYAVHPFVPMIDGDMAISIFPNPNHGNFSIAFKKSLRNVSIKIYDTLGKEIYSDLLLTTGHQKEISLTASAGIYFVELISGESRLVKKILVQ